MTSLPAADQRRDDGGFVTTEWAVGIATILLPIMVLAGLLPGWAAQHDAAGAAAREAARAAALAIDSGQAEHAGSEAARSLLAGRGIGPHGIVVEIHLPPPVDGQAPREGEVRAQVGITGDPLVVPFLGEFSPPTVSAEHRRRLNPFRSQP
ncbi:hypothetical protein [Euzebya tangerina]|uniref:hypothetical protein n=1 Tax=Euzebya tangerina TaxID=591198 RepID=UPI000E314A52|nr:hypothetical protein [Euzebya tangerina]